MKTERIRGIPSAITWRPISQVGSMDKTITTIDFKVTMVMQGVPTKKQINKMSAKISKLLKLVEVE